MALKSMELSKAEAKEEVAYEPELPRFPWGLCVELNDETLKKLGVTTPPAVGATVMFVAKAVVTSYSKRQDQTDTDEYLSLQITDMDLGGVPPDSSAAAAKLYKD